MIVTLTPNPSLDRTLRVDLLERGEVLRTEAATVEAGGKGINVARALHAGGYPVRAVLPSGGKEGDQLVALLHEAGLWPSVVRIAGTIRANTSIVEPDGTVTKLNEPGPRLGPDELEALLVAATSPPSTATWVVGSGSLPPAVADTFFADLVARARTAGSRVAIDTSGSAREAAIGAQPDLIKPNLDELVEVTGRRITTMADAVDAARALQEKTGGVVLASLGAEGALLADLDGVLHAESPVATPRSSVGAGDAMLAGYLSASASDRITALRTAVAYGAAAVALPGSQMPAPDTIRPERVRVTDQPAPERPLAPGTSPGPTASP